MARSPCLATARAHAVGEPTEVVGRRRSVRLVGEDEQGETRSAPDHRAVAQQSPEFGERHRKSRRIRTVDGVHDPVALPHVVCPQVPVATLLQAQY